MYLSSIKVKNFRSLQDVELELDSKQRQELSLIIGKNNTGKTSFIMIFEKFFSKERNFNFHDFSLDLRKKIYVVNEIDVNEIFIGLCLEITYNSLDNLEYLSEFIIDLTEDNNKVNLYFECSIDKKRLHDDWSNIDEDDRNRFIEKNLKNYLIENLYIYENEDDLSNDRNNLIKKNK